MGRSRRQPSFLTPVHLRCVVANGIRVREIALGPIPASAILFVGSGAGFGSAAVSDPFPKPPPAPVLEWGHTGKPLDLAGTGFGILSVGNPAGSARHAAPSQRAAV